MGAVRIGCIGKFTACSCVGCVVTLPAGGGSTHWRGAIGWVYLYNRAENRLDFFGGA